MEDGGSPSSTSPWRANAWWRRPRRPMPGGTS